MSKANDAAIARSVGDTQFGTSLKDVNDGDFDRGYSDGGPEGSPYEGYPFVHAGFIESDDYRSVHKFDDWSPRTDAGFVRRPTHKSDVERT